MNMFFSFWCQLPISVWEKKRKDERLEHNSLEVWLKDDFPFFLWVICRFKMLIFQGVKNAWQYHNCLNADPSGRKGKVPGPCWDI